MNMGTMLVILAFYLFLYLLYPFFKFIKKDSRCGAKVEAKLRHMLFWNHMITFITEGYLDILIAGSINVLLLENGEFSIEWRTASEIISNVLSFILLAFCGISLLFVSCYLWPKFSQLRKKSFKKKYEPAYEMLNQRRGHWTMLWPIFFMLRRIIFVVAVCLLKEYPVF